MFTLNRYDLIDVTKEALRYYFNDAYNALILAWTNKDIYKFNEISGKMLSILNDLEELLASDPHFLLGKWLSAARKKATNFDERNQYEWNARMQLTLWGTNTTSLVTSPGRAAFKRMTFKIDKI